MLDQAPQVGASLAVCCEIKNVFPAVLPGTKQAQLPQNGFKQLSNSLAKISLQNLFFVQEVISRRRISSLSWQINASLGKLLKSWNTCRPSSSSSTSRMLELMGKSFSAKNVPVTLSNSDCDHN